MANESIRAAAKTAGVKLWQIADVLGLSDANFSRVLRFELAADEREKILCIIERLKEEDRV